jgi:transcriptional regulator with XRE-family HTH domain
MERAQKHQKASGILGRLRICLDLSQEDLGTMLGTTGEGVRAWESGEAEIPEMTFARLVTADNALERMLWLFRPDRLPQVIRRRADAFDGERALEWILDGRIAEVADRYDSGLSFRRTA